MLRALASAPHPRPSLPPHAQSRRQAIGARPYETSVRFASVLAGAEKVRKGGENEQKPPRMPLPLSRSSHAASTLSLFSQAPMSRMEPDQFINDRYLAMEERIAVRFGCC